MDTGVTPCTKDIKKLSTLSPNTESYEDTFKTAYSHGLEAIYKLENVDLSSVRPINEKKQAAAPHAKKTVFIKPKEEQLQLDLGGENRASLEAFLLDEPIQVLDLSRYIEKSLSENGITLLRDLLLAASDELAILKGLGAGHIDEIEKKLRSYTKGLELFHSQRVDFASLIRCLLSQIDRKRAKVFLEPYRLAHLVDLKPVESIEVRRLTLEKRQEWLEEFKEYMQVKQEYVSTAIGDVVDVFIKPWMRDRLGIALKRELEERLQKISEEPELSEQALTFLSDLYFDEQFVLSKVLPNIEEELFFVDQVTFDRYQMIVEKARSYFYKPHIQYSLHELTSWIEREFALHWEGFMEGFVEKALRASPDYRVRKGIEGHLVIRLA